MSTTIPTYSNPGLGWFSFVGSTFPLTSYNQGDPPRVVEDTTLSNLASVRSLQRRRLSIFC